MPRPAPAISSAILRTHHLRPPSRPGELRLAAIDVGSNSIHMVIAQVDASGVLTELWRVKDMVGLGRISFPSHLLSHEAMERAITTLGRFLDEARRLRTEQIMAVATSAVREADNGGEFIQRVRRELGLHVRVVSAVDEARLIYKGVAHALSLKGDPSLIIDIGGGSAEFIVADDRRALLLESRKLGAARITARFVHSDPIARDEIKAMLACYDAELSPVMKSIAELRPARIIGTSGTLQNLAAMCADPPGAANARTLKRNDLEKLVGQLLESRDEDRSSIRGLDSQRQEQITAGALLALEIMRRLDARQIELCSSALREGLVVEHLARCRPELQIRREVPDPRRRSVHDLGRRCHWNRDHTEQVARLSLQLFDQLRQLHRLGRAERELLEYAALLHDIGAMIGARAHHKHSLYLILNGGLAGFSKEEIRIIANIARYHRKARPRRGHSEYASLRKPARRIVRIGAALLRVCDGLDRTNCSVIKGLRSHVTGRRVEVTLDNRGDAELEVWTARARGDLFRRVFKRSISFQCKQPR